MANGIPTGGAPLYLGDFASPMAAVSQKLTENMIAKYEQDRERKDNDRTALLKALDFTAVEGLSEKVSQEMLNKYNELEDKWTQRYMDNDLRLSDQDYFELNKDKRNLEQYQSKLRYNVSQLANIQNIARTRPDILHPQTLRNLSTFIENGDVGRDVSGIFVPKFNASGWFNKNLAPGIKAIEPAEVTTFDAENKRNITVKTNRDRIDEHVDTMIQNNPELQYLKENDELWPEYEATLRGMARPYYQDGVPYERPATSAQLRDLRTANLTPEQKELNDEYGLAERGIDPKYWGNVATLNTQVMGVLQGNKDAIAQMEGNYNPDLGRISKIYLTENDIVLLGTRKGSDGKILSVSIPRPDMNNPEEVRAAMQKLAGEGRYAIMKDASSLPTDKTGIFFHDWNVKANGEPVQNTMYEDVKENLLNYPKDDAGREKFKDNILKSLNSEFMFEEKQDAEERAWYRRGDIKWNGNVYKLSSEADRKKLINDIEVKKGFPVTKWGEEAEKTKKETYTSTQEEGIKLFMEKNNLSREEAIKVLKEANRL